MAVATASPGDEVTSELWNTLAGLVNGTSGYGNPVILTQLSSNAAWALTVRNQGSAGQALRVQSVDGTYNLFSVQQAASPVSLVIGTTLASGEKGVQVGWDTASLNDAATIQAMSGTARRALHLNPIAADTDPQGNTVVIGAKLAGYDGQETDYVALIAYSNDQAAWGGLLIDAETKDATGTTPDNGGDVNAQKIIITNRTASSYTRMRGLEIQIDRYKNGAATAPNIGVSRGVDVGVFVDAQVGAGREPWEYAGFYAVSRNSSYTSRQANSAYYAGGAVGSPATTPGWEYGFYHDLGEPTATQDPGFYSTANGDIFVKRGLNLGTGAAASATIRMDVRSQTAGSDNCALLYHGNNSDVNSHAFWWARVGGGSGGDPYVRFTVDGATDWTIGADNSDSDRLKIGPASTVGTSTALTLDTNGNIVVGTAALATNATNGFLYIPTCAGTPTGVPTAYTGRVAMIFDTSGNELWIYDGAWISTSVFA